MTDHSWLIILSIGFFIVTVTFLAAAIFLIYVAVEIKKSAAAIREFLNRTDERIKPVLADAEQVIKNLKGISSDVGTVTENVRNFSGVVSEIATNLKVLSSMLSGLSEGLSVRALGIKAGIKTALEVLIKQIKERRS
jgi:uncharacterized protein YoxC